MPEPNINAVDWSRRRSYTRVATTTTSGNHREITLGGVGGTTPSIKFEVVETQTGVSRLSLTLPGLAPTPGRIS
eukprot:7393398-Pyramimonas_sp.AAC.1